MFHPLLNIIELRTTHNPSHIAAHDHMHHSHSHSHAHAHSHAHYCAQKQYPFGEGPHGHDAHV